MFNFYGAAQQTRKFPMNAIIYLSTLSKSSTKLTYIHRELLKMGRNSSKFWRKSTFRCERIQDNQHFLKNYNQTLKIKKLVCKSLCILTKNEDLLNFIKKILRFLVRLSMENCPLQFLRNIYASSQEVYTAENNTNFPHFWRGGDVLAFPLNFK